MERKLSRTGGPARKGGGPSGLGFAASGFATFLSPRGEGDAARPVRDRSGARTPAVTASSARSTVPARGQTSGSNLVAGSSCRTSSRRAASGLPVSRRPPYNAAHRPVQ